MSFSQELQLVFLDSLLIGAGIIVVGYWINRRLERDKTNEDIRKQAAAARANAYLSLWQLTAKIDALGSKLSTNEESESMLKEVTDWYYKEGNGLYLSHPATTKFLAARALLKKTAPDIAEVKKNQRRLFRTANADEAGHRRLQRERSAGAGALNTGVSACYFVNEFWFFGIPRSKPSSWKIFEDKRLSSPIFQEDFVSIP